MAEGVRKRSTREKVLNSSGRENGRLGGSSFFGPRNWKMGDSSFFGTGRSKNPPSSKNLPIFEEFTHPLPSSVRSSGPTIEDGERFFDLRNRKIEDGRFLRKLGKGSSKNPPSSKNPLPSSKKSPPIFEEPLFYLRRTPNLCSSIPKIEKPLPSHLRSSKPKIRSKVAMGISPICNEFTQTKKHQSTGQQQETKNRWSSANKLLVNGGSNAVVLLPSVYI